MLSACAPHGGALPSAPSSPSGGAHIAATTTTTPGDSLKPMPGDSLKPMPGAKLGCNIVPPNGSTLCTIALNINVPPQPNANTPPQFLSGLQPADLRSAYNLPSSNAGGLVAIVDAYDNPNAEADLAIYRTAMGLPACTSLNGCFKKLNQSGASSSYPVFDAAWAQEESLDLDVVSAVCPNCHIALVEANSNSIDDLGKSVNAAAALHPIAISNSYYAFEWSGETTKQSYFNHPGIAITAAAGDQPYVSFPAASPYVTSVGGTSLSHGSTSWTDTAAKAAASTFPNHRGKASRRCAPRARPSMYRRSRIRKPASQCIAPRRAVGSLRVERASAPRLLQRLMHSRTTGTDRRTRTRTAARSAISRRLVTIP